MWYFVMRNLLSIICQTSIALHTHPFPDISSFKQVCSERKCDFPGAPLLETMPDRQTDRPTNQPTDRGCWCDRPKDEGVSEGRDWL